MSAIRLLGSTSPSRWSLSANSPLLISQKSSGGLSPGSYGFAPGEMFLPEVIEFDITKKTVVFVNGREETDVDEVIFCTGYNYAYPLLKELADFESTVMAQRPTPTPTNTCFGLYSQRLLSPFCLSESSHSHSRSPKGR